MKNTHNSALEALVQEYYAENFIVSSVDLSTKTKFMNQLIATTRVRRVSPVRQVVGYLTAATFIGIASYISVDSMIDMTMNYTTKIVE